jgi:hypothetical protein
MAARPFPSERRGPLYDNVKLVAPDGEVLSTCSRHKAEWYMKRGLATMVSHSEDSDALVIQLNFEPAGRRKADEEYEVVDKENVCVRCGAAEHHVRHHVVPRQYRYGCPQESKSLH